MSLLGKNSKFWKILQTLCLFNERILLMKISAKSSCIWERKSIKTPKNGPFHGWSLLGKNSKFWKILQTLCLFNERILLMKISAKSSCIWERKSIKTPKNVPFHGWYENLGKFIIWQSQMVYLRNLPRLCNFTRPLFCLKLGA